MTKTDLYWLAGLLEGEATFSLNQGRYPVIQIESTDEDVIERVRILLGIQHTYVRTPRQDYHKTSYAVALYGATAREWMARLEPLMGQRRKARIRECLDIYSRHTCCMQRK